jgi:protein-arginine kinase
MIDRQTDKNYYTLLKWKKIDLKNNEIRLSKHVYSQHLAEAQFH